MHDGRARLAVRCRASRAARAKIAIGHHDPRPGLLLAGEPDDEYETLAIGTPEMLSGIRRTEIVITNYRALQQRKSIALSEIPRSSCGHRPQGGRTGRDHPRDAANGMTSHGKTCYLATVKYLATRWPGDAEFSKASGASLTLARRSIPQ